MFPLFPLFNSVIFMLINLTIGLIVCKRFFGEMRTHYKLVAEVTEFNFVVRQSRESLQYIGSKVSEAMKEIEGDIGRDLHMTHHVTKLSAKVATLLKRYTAFEESVIEVARMDLNTENAELQTPSDINEEVKRALSGKKPEARPRTPKKPKISSASSLGGQSPVMPQAAIGSGVARDVISENAARPRTPLVPEVKLLNDRRPRSAAKPIGFRPSWKCEA
ncbi:uncharacterized protein LOC105700739 [Orussus abietinus]|uniref:uncharacterized protein LOC105700739 n=1 Tax=Orussus abietinus TaxID=222816 RepID=UPI000625156D|nr:uncharacterized protein LOC105700739 [Orussus abietinus]